MPLSENVKRARASLRRHGLHTVCEEAQCPNRAECWSQGHATFLILGDVCSRNCGFCAVSAGVPAAVDPREPGHVAEAAASLRCASLRYLDVALERRPGTDHHWTYVPERKYPFYRVGSYSNFSPGVAPRGKGSLYVELASRRPIRLDSLLPRVAAGLIEMKIIERESDIAFVRPRRIRHAYVVYDRRWARSRKTVIDWLASRGIFTAGRYGRWEYAAMENAIVQGMEAARSARKL